MAEDGSAFFRGEPGQVGGREEASNLLGRSLGMADELEGAEGEQPDGSQSGEGEDQMADAVSQRRSGWTGIYGFQGSSWGDP